MPEVFESYATMQRFTADECLLYGMNDQLGILSPSSSSMSSHATSASPSPMSVSSSPPHNMPFQTHIDLNNAAILGHPHIVILEQPIEKFRFRYKSEMMGTHGSLAGASSSGTRKKPAPTVELVNFPGQAIIRCTLVTADPDHRGPHAHHLVGRAGNDDCDDPHEITVSPEHGFQASFQGMGIIHTAKKHIKEELVRKNRQQLLEDNRRKNINVTALTVREEAQIKMDAEGAQKWMNLNSVALCFQAFVLNANGIPTPITPPVYSNPINNLKSALTGELKICRIDKCTSSCDGGEEIFILVEKVGKKNIKIKFFELNEDDQEVWTDYGRFSELDVHHQYAIVFRTPPYKDREISSLKEVFVQLYRPTDGDCSEPIKFTFKPSDRVLGRKRRRFSFNSSSSEFIPQLFPLLNTKPDNTFETVPQNSSTEILALLKDDASSAEFRDFLNNTNIDEYVELIDIAEENRLETDGESMKENDRSFARDILSKVVETMKKNPTDYKEQVLTLMKERTAYSDSPLHSALRHEQHDFVKYILMLLASSSDYKPFINAQNSSGKTCLHYAVMQNQYKVTKALLLLGADPNACDDHGCSALHAAVQYPAAGKCLDALLSAKPNIEARNDDGWTPLHVAAETGSVYAVCSLVKAGANVNSTETSFGRTALHIAVEGGHKDVVQFLLKDTSIDVNKRNVGGNTALHSAVVNTGTLAKELCDLLVRHGADPSIANDNRESTKEVRNEVTVKREVDSEDEAADEKNGQTSFDLASNNPEILQLLSRSNSTQENALALNAMVEIKEEVLDESESQSDRWLDNKTATALAKVLDRSKGWETLAERLGYSFLLGTLRKGDTSPSLMLLNYADLQGGVTPSKLLNILDDLGEEEAVKLIDAMVSKV